MGNRIYDESYLMNNIDAPFLCTFQDLPLFTNNIQSCLHSACISSQHHSDKNEEEMKQIYFDKRQISETEYTAYLSAREILIDKLLNFAQKYAKNNQKDADKYYENTLPFVLYSLIIILYESAKYIE